jgi:hypothetical protein
VAGDLIVATRGSRQSPAIDLHNSVRLSIIPIEAAQPESRER